MHLFHLTSATKSWFVVSRNEKMARMFSLVHKQVKANEDILEVTIETKHYLSREKYDDETVNTLMEFLASGRTAFVRKRTDGIWVIDPRSKARKMNFYQKDPRPAEKFFLQFRKKAPYKAKSQDW